MVDGHYNWSQDKPVDSEIQDKQEEKSGQASHHSHDCDHKPDMRINFHELYCYPFDYIERVVRVAPMLLYNKRMGISLKFEFFFFKSP